MSNTFAPTVKMQDGQTVTPRGWMWVLGFALAGCDWAIKEADTEEFRQLILNDIAAAKRTDLLNSVKYYEEKLIELKEKLRCTKINK